MTNAAKIVTGGLALAALIGIGFLPILPPDPAAVAAAQADTERVIAEAKVESEARFREEYIRLVYLRDGNAAGDLYVRCTGNEPPQKPANQAKCKALLDRLQREDAKEAAAETKKKSEW